MPDSSWHCVLKRVELWRSLSIFPGVLYHIFLPLCVIRGAAADAAVAFVRCFCCSLPLPPLPRGGHGNGNGGLLKQEKREAEEKGRLGGEGREGKPMGRLPPPAMPQNETGAPWCPPGTKKEKTADGRTRNRQLQHDFMTGPARYRFAIGKNGRSAVLGMLKRMSGTVLVNVEEPYL